MAMTEKQLDQLCESIHAAGKDELMKLIKKYERKAMKGKEPEKTLYYLAKRVLAIKNSEHTGNARW